MGLPSEIAYGVLLEDQPDCGTLRAAHSGIGYLMQLSQDLAQIDRIIAICLWIVAFVIVGEPLSLVDSDFAFRSKGRGAGAQEAFNDFVSFPRG